MNLGPKLKRYVMRKFDMNKLRRHIVIFSLLRLTKRCNIMDLFQSNLTFWAFVESDICTIPNYIKNILTFCNFGNVLSLQKFEKDDINKIENMIKSQLKEFLDENTQHPNYVDYFGPIYHNKPEQFQLTCGDIKMIYRLSDYVQVMVRKTGFGYFQGRCNSNNSNNDNSDHLEEELRGQLFDATLNLLQPYGVTSLFKKDMVSVSIVNGEVKGTVRCVICDNETITKKRRKDTYSQYWNGQKWSLSNFASHHLNKVHPIAQNADQASKTTYEGNYQMKTSHSTSSADDYNSNASNSLNDDCIVDGMEEGSSIIELKIEPQKEFAVQLGVLRAQLRFHIIEMTNTAFQNREEGLECEIQLSDGLFSKIEIYPIPADGNCLLGAIVHQLYKLNINSVEYVNKVGELRKEVIAHINTNLEQYKRTLFGRVYNNRCENDGYIKNENDEEELKTFLDGYLSKDTAWAGPETILAISEMFKTNVVIFNEWGEVNCGNYFDSSYEDIITLAFRVSKKHKTRENVPNTKRNHYDSVIKINDDVLDKCASMILINHAKSLSVRKISQVINIE